MLVVEGESFNRALIADYLAEAGFSVDAAGDTDWAARLVDADGYSLLVADTGAPGRVCVADLLRRFQTEKSSVRVVVIAARPEVLGKLKAAGVAATLIRRPFDPEQLVGMVTRLVQEVPSSE